MKKFKFRLDPLLRYRTFQEHQQKMAVAAAHHAVIACEARIESVIQATDHTATIFDERMAEGMSAERIHWFNNYIESLIALRASEEKKRKELLKELNRQREKLTARTIAKKVVENLKERKQEAYYQQIFLAEQQVLDDLVILRNSRGTN